MHAPQHVHSVIFSRCTIESSSKEASGFVFICFLTFILVMQLFLKWCFDLRLLVDYLAPRHAHRGSIRKWGRTKAYAPPISYETFDRTIIVA